MSKEVGTVLTLIGVLIGASLILNSAPMLYSALRANADFTLSVEDGFYIARYHNDTIAYNETDANTIFNSVLQNNTVIYCRAGDYDLDQTLTGIDLYYKVNITLVGDGEDSKITNTYNASSQQIMDIHEVDNMTFYAMHFDGDMLNKVPNEDENGTISLGTQWLFRLYNTSDIGFYNCQFTNGIEDGLTGAWDNGNGVFVEDCLFKNFGEHPIYTSDLATNWTVKDSKFLNWAKVARGYGTKFANTTNVYVYNCIFDPYEDGQGVKSNVPEGSGGSATFVSTGTNHTYENCRVYSPALVSHFNGVDFETKNTIMGTMEIKGLIFFTTHKYH